VGLERVRIEVTDELVFSVAIGRQVEMLTEEGTTIQIEGPIEVLPSGLKVEPGSPPSDGERALLGILYSRIVACEVKDSVLTILFSNDMSLRIPHTEGFEAWNVSTPTRNPNLIVMGPTGQTMVF